MLFSHCTNRQNGFCILLKPSACNLLVELDSIRLSARRQNYLRGSYTLLRGQETVSDSYFLQPIAFRVENCDKNPYFHEIKDH